MKKFNREKVISYLNQFKENNDGNNEFYIALLIYDRLGLNTEDVTDEIMEQVGNLYESCETIYNENLNDELYELEGEF